MRLFTVLSEINTSLMEASAKTRYMKMFEVFPKEILQANHIQFIEKNLEWAQRILKKEDRIIWFLRYVRLALIQELDNPQFKNAFTKEVKNMSNKGQVSDTDVVTGIAYVVSNQFKTEISHFLGMPIPDIQKIQFGWLTPRDLINTLKEIEKDFFDDQDRLIDDDPELDVVIDFGDGFAWYDLGRASCDIEANAMGHCGNSPRAYTNDTILSLRKTVKMGNDIKRTPVLTFILNNDGFLLEMKGRGNQKPASRYHKYIVPLLKHNRIEGIIGGGYKPENNFSINDLPNSVRQELLNEKPALMSLSDFVNEKKPNAHQLQRLIVSRLDMYNIGGGHDLYIKEDGDKVEIVLNYWTDLERFAREAGDNPVLSLLDALDDVSDMNTNVSGKLNEPEFLEAVIRRLPKKYIKMAFDSVNIKPDIKNLGAVIERLISYKTDFYQSIIKSVIFDEKEYKEKLQDRLNDYIDNNWYLAIGGSSSIEIRDDGSVEAVCDLETMIDMLETAADPENDWGNFYGDIGRLQYEGVSALMDDQNRGEDNNSDYDPPLNDLHEADTLVSDGIDIDEDLTPSYVADKFIDYMEGRIDDPRQGELGL